MGKKVEEINGGKSVFTKKEEVLCALYVMASVLVMASVYVMASADEAGCMQGSHSQR
jgi:hypothetical protein